MNHAMKILLSLCCCAFLVLCHARAEDVFRTGFEEGEGFTGGPVEAQNGWASEKYSQGGAVASIVRGGEGGAPAPAAGGQQLMLVRSAGEEGAPGAGVAFLSLSRGLKMPFEFSYSIALVPSSPIPFARVQIGDGTSGANGAISGICGSPEDRQCYLFAKDGAATVYLDADPDSEGVSPIVSGHYYRVVISVSPETATYGIKVFAGGRLADSRENLRIERPPQGYNRILATMPGGKNHDAMCLDELSVTVP